MKNELFDYLNRIFDELNAIYEGRATNEDGETASMWDYTGDILDYEFTISSSGELLGVRAYVTLGGPNVWIDTRDGEIAGAWGTDRASRWLPSEICEELNEVFGELYRCTRNA